MKEKLIIKNFGPIRHIDLDLTKFNVLIGEQATGKSTVAKVLAVCRYYSYIRPEMRVIGGLTNFAKGLEDWGLKEFLKKDSHIFYENEHYSISVDQILPQFSTIQSEENSIVNQNLLQIFQPSLIAKSEEFKTLLVAEAQIFSRSRSGPAVLPPSFFQNNVSSVMDNPFYLPTERGLQSVFSLGKGGIQNISDALFNQLARLNQITGEFDNETLIEPIGVTYKNIDGRGYTRRNIDDEFYSLLNGASGYQSSIPIVLVSEYYHRILEKVKTLIIEEPELNLFPVAQDRLMRYLVEKVMTFGNTVLATTHSPYVLTSLNNMMYAYQVGQSQPLKTERIIERRHWLNPLDVSAYMLHPDGKTISILDREINQIDAGAIDGASRQVNKEWNQILKIELDGK